MRLAHAVAILLLWNAAVAPRPLSANCSASKSSKVCTRPAAKATNVIMAVMTTHFVVEFFGCARPCATFGNLQCSVVVFEVLGSGGSGTYSGVAKVFVAWACSMLALFIATVAFAGAEAGSCRVVGVGVDVAVAALSIASRTRCLRTSRNRWDAEA
eukprot:6082485-Pleurochrysis_carterae.AAC.1